MAANLGQDIIETQAGQLQEATGGDQPGSLHGEAYQTLKGILGNLNGQSSTKVLLIPNLLDNHPNL